MGGLLRLGRGEGGVREMLYFHFMSSSVVLTLAGFLTITSIFNKELGKGWNA